MRIVIKPANSTNIKVLEYETQEIARAAIVAYLNEAAPGNEPSFYRVIMPLTAGGDIVLRKLRLNPTTIVTTEVIQSADVEDDV